MCDARGLWNLPRSCRQGKVAFLLSETSMISFGFLKKSLFAYHIEALVPTSPQSTLTQQTPQKLNGSKDVHFFSVGSLQGRTLVIYMKKKGVGFCSFALALESIPYWASSWTVYSACSSLFLARSTRGQKLRCLLALDSACDNSVQSGSAFIECVHLIYHRLEYPRLTSSNRTFSFRRSHMTSSS